MTKSVKDFYPADLASALGRAMTWMLSRQNVDVSPFTGNAVETPTTPALVEGAVDTTLASFSTFAQDPWPNIVFDPIADLTLDEQTGPDGFLINYSPTPLLSGNLLINLLPLAATTNVSGRAFNLLQPASQYRVDVYSRTDVFYYQGSSAIGADGAWSVAGVAAGTAIALLMPATAPQPAPGSWTAQLTGWVAHSNLGVGNKLHDYFVRVFSRTDSEYLQEDSIPIIVQDSTHARFGTCCVTAAGTPTAHVIYNHPQLGEVDLYSTLQNLAVYSDLPRSIEVPPGDPDYATPSLMTSSNLPFIQNRCWIYDAALAIIVFTVVGLWDAAKRIVTRLNALRGSPGYLPSLNLENAEDGSIARWSLVSGAGTQNNQFDSTEPPSGSRVMVFNATATPAVWNYVGSGLPHAVDTIADFRFKASGAGASFKFILGVTTSTGQVTSIELVSSGTAGYNGASKKITAPLTWVAGQWRALNEKLDDLIHKYLPNESFASITSFQVELDAAGELRLDNLSVGAPLPEGALGFSYDVYNGQVDQTYIRNGAMAWVAYAYAIYMERTADFATAALGLESMVGYLFTQQSTAADARHNLIMLGYGRYQQPGYQYVPGQITSVSTEHNIDAYFAFDKAARVFPTAAQNLLDRGLITHSQFDSLQTTAGIAAAKAAQIRAAIPTQLWIPAAGGVKGHFAEGATSSGLDTALALDAAGSWAALFCHEIGDDAKAVECLKFIYETFFLANQQILKSSDANSYNQAYEQLTAFDGFKPYADSAGGYSGSPASIWMEGTWGALAAYLRLSDDASLQAYFATLYSGGFEGFVARLVQSMKIVGATTADGGLLNFSLAARGLPWEFSVRKTLGSTAWFWLTAARNDILFTTALQPSAGRALLKVPRGVEQSVRQLEGQGSIGALELEAIDGAGYLTALASGGKLEGRRVTLKVGYPGMTSSEFATVATQEIESVNPLPDLTGYVLECRDLKRSAKTKVFTRGDDGAPISSDHPRRLLANPMDVLLIVLQNELGLGQSPTQPESAWKLYDPTQWGRDLDPFDPHHWSLRGNPTLIYPNPYVDVDQLLSYRNGIFAGYLLEFTFQQAVEAKQFLEYEVFRTLGGYMLVLADGRLSPRFFVPPYSLGNLFAFNERNITILPSVERQPVINQVTFRMDYDGDSFLTELLFVDAPSLQQYGLAGEHTIESKGLRLARGGASLAGLTASRAFRRYSGMDPVSGAPNGGAVVLTVESHFLTLTVEVGDLVYLTHPLLPNFQSGRRGVSNRIYEVIEKQPNFGEGTMTYRLLDMGWLAAKKLSRVAPQGTPTWPAATQAQRDRYMFACNDATGEYSDGGPGKTIF
ncbi:MAG: hypothetical protein LAN62_14950 [Acidobacteriia bacterium]|nr:hypothetical protein [Terriglobia bacterium]